MRTDRRHVLLGAGATMALAALPVRARPAGGDAAAQAVLDGITEQLLKDQPESATGLGIDKGDRIALKHRLADRSQHGLHAMAGHLTAAIADIRKLDPSGLSETMRVNLDVTRAAFESALKGFAFGYGDVAVGGWRNSPYVVIQNVGAFLDIPKMLDSDHTIASRDDADAYIDRVDSYADQLDGETERLKAAAARGVIAPDFLLDKALKQLRIARSGNLAGWGLVTSVANRTADILGNYGQHAFDLCTARVAPALDRQIAELERHRARATGDAGVWKFPDGDAYYAWALSAGTTTTMSPEEVHAMGLDQLAKLQAEMDVILTKEGYSQGSVGARMTALGKDPRFTFPDNDEGRAQIMALLRDRVTDIRGKMPNAFHTLVRGNVEVKRMPPEEEPGAPGAYGGPGTIDGTVPGRLWINLRSTGI